jgi:hypothetical protein
MKPIYLTKGGKRLVMAEHMKKIASATGLNANGSVPCKILKFLICSIPSLGVQSITVCLPSHFHLFLEKH